MVCLLHMMQKWCFGHLKDERAQFTSKSGRRFHLRSIQEGSGDGGPHCTDILISLLVPLVHLHDSPSAPRPIFHNPTGYVVLFMPVAFLTALFPSLTFSAYNAISLCTCCCPLCLCKAHARPFHFIFQRLWWLPNAYRTRS